MTTFSAKGKGLNVTIKDREPDSYLEIAKDYYVYGPNTIEKVTIETELVTDEDTGHWAVWEVEEIPEF